MPRSFQHAFQLAAALLPCLTSASLAQKPAPQKSVTVTVVDAHVDPPQPVPAIRVSLTYLDGSGLHTDARDDTSPRGQAFLTVTPDTAQRDDLRLVIHGNPKLVIFEPADGQLHGIAATVPVKLLPIGSAALSGPAQIEAVQRRLSQRIITLQTRNQKMENELTAVKAQSEEQKHAVDEGLDEWSKAVGLELPAAQKKVLEWARQIQSEPGTSAERRALAAFALKNYGQAADLFGEATDDEMASLDQLRKQQQEQNRLALQKILETTKQHANALQLAARYHDATAALLKTRNYAASLQQQSPEDSALRSIWLQSIAAVAKAEQQEAKIASPDQRLPLLQKAMTDLGTVQRAYAKSNDRQGVAVTQRGEAEILVDEVEDTNLAGANPLIDKALDFYNAALAVFTQENSAEDWASIQFSIGIALQEKGKRNFQHPQEDLPEALEKYRAALGVYSRAKHPQDWARVNKAIGDVLALEAFYAGFDRGVDREKQSLAEAAYLSALDVFTKRDNPQEWAQTQMSLGDLLVDETDGGRGNHDRAILTQAAECYRRALEVSRKEELPQPFANAELHLAQDLKPLGEMTPGDDGVTLLQQSLGAFAEAFDIYRKLDVPVEIGYIHQQVADAHRSLANRLQADRAQAEYALAISEFQESEATDSKQADLGSWAYAESEIGDILVEEANRLDKSQAKPLLQTAAEDFRQALDAYGQMSARGTILERNRLLTALSLNRLKETFGDKELPNDIFEEGLTSVTDTKAVLGLVTDIYHEHLFRFDRAYELDMRKLAIDPSAGARLDFMEAGLTADQDASCVQQTALLDTAKLQPAQVVFKDLFQMACGWASASKSRAFTARQKLEGETGALKKNEWNFTGTLHFLANSPKFEPGRSAWIALFTAAQDGDSAAMMKALHDLEPLMQN